WRRTATSRPTSSSVRRRTWRGSPTTSWPRSTACSTTKRRSCSRYETGGRLSRHGGGNLPHGPARGGKRRAADTEGRGAEMSDDEDRTPTLRRRTGEGVRIIGVEEAAAALEEGKVSG